MSGEQLVVWYLAEEDCLILLPIGNARWIGDTIVYPWDARTLVYIGDFE